MPDSEDEDDTHFCIKCHLTIIGLDRYVAHRKAKCKSDGEVRADDFFSSLCLQSSTKGFWPPPGHTGGKWKPHQADTLSQDERRDVPPPTHTGGKWRPQPSGSSGNQEDRRDEPPPTHTGGKWRPQPSRSSINQGTEGPSVPPPDHTRGKWGPAERPWGQLGKGVYWCGPCNRRLSSRVVYDRHVRSELHFKRTNHWPTPARINEGRRTRVRTKTILASSLTVINRRYTQSQEVTKVRKRRGGPQFCEGCRCKVWPHLMGKHLVSHYHYRHRAPGTEGSVLKQMGSIVRQAPFQCALCKFYTNTVQDFMAHWASDLHRQNDISLEGRYWCGLCKWSCETSVTMGYHLTTEGHNEMVSVINRSVPIIIQKRVSLTCYVCSRGYRFNAELRAHARKWNHKQREGTGSDAYQELMICEDCDYKGHSLESYQRHIRLRHGKELHFCRKCDIRFDSLDEAREHRKKAEHRECGRTEPKHCIHCDVDFPGLAALRQHLTTQHPDQRHRCLKCAAEFILKQELSQHAKWGGCEPKEDVDNTSVMNRYKCNTCPFSCDAESDIMLHKTLHGTPSANKYPCLFCDSSFSKNILKHHIRTHTAERPFACYVCTARFSRRDALIKHIKTHDSTRTPSCRLCSAEFSSSKLLCRHMNIHHERKKNFSCTECSDSFYDKASLEKHSQLHWGKRFSCTMESCIFKARSEAELRNHEKTHGQARDYHCAECTYSAKTKSQLTRHTKSQHGESRLLQCPHCDFISKNATHIRRHIKLHTGTKPYQCPHCTFSCSLLENLRKHVIYSKLHPGKFLYECAQCEMKTNLSKELRSHLVEVHAIEPRVAASTAAAFYTAQPRSELVPVTANKRKKKPEPEAECEEQNMPTLASVALGSHEEDVIFIEVEDGLESVLYQPGDTFQMESYGTGTHH